MSKTDKTAPWTVRVYNRPYWLEEYHDHRNGVCDLPERPAPGVLDSVFSYGGQCGWRASHEFWCVRQNACGCPWCNDTQERRQRTRRNRRAVSRYARGGWRNEY
jgi:hypothetical protein